MKTIKQLVKEIGKEKQNAYSYQEIDGDVLAGTKDFDKHILVKELQAQFQILEDVLKLIDEYTKKKYQMHCVDECACCEKNLKNIQELKQMIQGK